MPGGDIDDNEAVETLTHEEAEAMAAAQAESEMLKNLTTAAKLLAAATHAHRFGPPTVEIQSKLKIARDKKARQTDRHVKMYDGGGEFWNMMVVAFSCFFIV